MLPPQTGPGAKLCPKCRAPLPEPSPSICPNCGATLKQSFGPVVPGLCAFLLGLVALGSGALATLGAANDALTYGDPNTQGSGSLFTIAFLSGAAAIGIVVWLLKRPK